MRGAGAKTLRDRGLSGVDRSTASDGSATSSIPEIDINIKRVKQKCKDSERLTLWK